MIEEDAIALHKRVVHAFAADTPLKRRCEISLVYYQPPGLHSVASWKVRIQSGTWNRIYTLLNEQDWQECKLQLDIEEE